MATTNLDPAADVGTQDWTSTGANSFSVIGGTPSTGTENDASYIETSTPGDSARVSFDATPANTSEVTAITIRVRARITDASTTAVIETSIYHTGDPGTQIGTTIDIAGTSEGEAYGAFGFYDTTAAWTGLTLTKTQADSLNCDFVFAAS